MMEDEREEGEIVDVIDDDDIYENIISSDEVDEDDLRQRIEELEAKNSELEKIASISKTYDYGLGCGSSNFINLVDDDGGDDDESYYRQPSKYDYSNYTSSSRKRSRSKRRKACRHECKKSKRHRSCKMEKRKKTQLNRTRIGSDSSSDDEFQLDRNKLQAALKRNTPSIHSSTTLKRKLIGVSKTVEEFIKAKEDVGDEDISSSIEIMHLLNRINIEEIAPKSKPTVSKEDSETESGLNEQELRIIALKSAILKKAEVRKKRKIIETQPYSPTDDVAIENVIGSKASVNTKPKDELDNMEISPAESPTHQDGCLQPIDMELESDEENQKDGVPSIVALNPVQISSVTADDLYESLFVPDDMSLSNANDVPEDTDQNKLCFAPAQEQKQQRTELEDEDEEALRASLLANMRAAKKKSSTKDLPATQKPVGADSLHVVNTISDTAIEMERLRKQVFSSMGKRKESLRQMLPNPFAQKFSLQVPKPMEMTMPQITSNLKEALKRIKERDKQNVETEVILETEETHARANVVPKAAKEIPVELNQSTTTQAEIQELKIIAQKLNGANVTPKVTPALEPIAIVRTSSEPNNKVNDVLKNVTCNNASIETKMKDGGALPVVKSNKIETALSEKSDAAIRSVKAVAQKKVITEPQKENQQLRKVGVSPKRTSEDKLSIAKKAKSNNVSRVSRVITTPVEKPVKKMIIQLNNSDTESDDLGLGQQTTDPCLDSKSYSGVASPVSFNFFSPSSPANAVDIKPSDAIPSNNDSFQRKLDEYLKSARTMVELKKQELKPIKKSPSLVSHLPPSSQLEYRKLINRMALLEKQKLVKLSKSKAAAASKPRSINNISVTIVNDSCNQQPKPEKEIGAQIVQLNCTVDSSPKDNQKEVSAEVKTVDPVTRQESKIPSHTSSITAGCKNRMKPIEPKLPEKCDKITESVPPKLEEPVKSTNFMQNFATLSELDRKEMLQKSEAEYMGHSELYLVDLNHMSELVNKARQEKEKQFQMETELAALEARVADLKKQLVEQKASVSKLYPVISTSHKSIMMKRSKSIQLNKKCYLLGRKIVGTDYKIPGDPKADIAQKVKSLSSQTKLLRNMKKHVPSGSVAASTSSNNDEQTEHVNEHTSATASNPTTTILQSTESNPANNTPQSPINGASDNNIPLPYTMMKYNSPLDHMKNIGVTNPDSILCPFQLLGQCEDKECTYQHLSN